MMEAIRPTEKNMQLIKKNKKQFFFFKQKMLIEAQEKGVDVPDVSIKFPPGYLDVREIISALFYFF